MTMIKRADLLEGLKKVARVVPSNSALEVLKGVLINMSNGEMKISSTNLATSIISRISCDTGMFDDTFIIESKLFLDIISKISSEDVEITYSENTVTIKGNSSVFNIKSFADTEAFPEVEKSITDKKEIVIEGDVLKELINKTYKFASDDDSRPILGGIYLSFSENQVLAVTLDGYRLGHCVAANIENDKVVDFVIRASDLVNVSRIIDKDNVTISFNDELKLVEFNVGGTSLITTTLDGAFFDFKKIFKVEDYTSKLTVSTKDMKDSIGRTNIFSKTSGGGIVAVTFNVEDDFLVITTKSEIGEVTEKVAITSLEGESTDYSISFNSLYLLDGLNVLSSEEMEIRLNGELQPAYLVDKNDTFTYFLLPIRMAS